MNNNATNQYIGTKLIKAVKQDKNGIEGFKIVYSNDYESWSPSKPFLEAYHKLNGLTELVKHPLFTEKYTRVLHDEESFNAPNNYLISDRKGNLKAAIHFQEGAMNETELNGVFIEDLIIICIHRLEQFQKSNLKCNENARAIKKLEETLLCLKKRNVDRTNRGVVGTLQP